MIESLQVYLHLIMLLMTAAALCRISKGRGWPETVFAIVGGLCLAVMFSYALASLMHIVLMGV